MSANLVVDLGGTCQMQVSAQAQFGGASGVVIGEIVDMLDANTATQVIVNAGPGSGLIMVAIQTSDQTTSGSFTDPTSGLPTDDLPGKVASGGIFVVNNGLAVSGRNPFGTPAGNNVAPFSSGGMDATYFLRPHRYARLNIISGGLNPSVTASLLGNLKTVGSGGGFTQSPLPNSPINV